MPVFFAISIIVHLIVGASIEYPPSIEDYDRTGAKAEYSEVQREKALNNRKQLLHRLLMISNLRLDRLKEGIDDQQLDKINDRIDSLIFDIQLSLSLTIPNAKPKRRELNPLAEQRERFFAWLPFIIELSQNEVVNPENILLFVEKITTFAKELKKQERHFDRVYLGSEENKWLARLNFRRKFFYDVFNPVYESGQNSLIAGVATSKGNHFVWSNIFNAVFYAQGWDNDLPKELKLQQVLFEDYFSVALVIPAGFMNREKPQVLDLVSGDSYAVDEVPGHVYLSEVMAFSFLRSQKESPSLKLDDLVVYRSNFSSEKNQYFQEWGQYFDEVIFDEWPLDKAPIRSSNSNFGYIPYSHFRAPLKDSTESSFKVLGLTSNITQNLGEVKEGPPVNQKESAASNPSTESAQQLIDESLSEVFETNQQSLSEAERRELDKAALEMVKDMAKANGDLGLFKALQEIDSDLFEKARKNPESLTEEEKAQLEFFKKAIQDLSSRKLQIKNTPNFLANIRIRIATPKELKSEFDPRIPYLAKPLEPKLLNEMILKSAEKHIPTRGFDFRILQPEIEVVVRTQQELDILSKLPMKDLYRQLLLYSQQSFAELLEGPLAVLGLALKAFNDEEQSYKVLLKAQLDSDEIQQLEVDLPVLGQLIDQTNKVIQFAFHGATIEGGIAEGSEAPNIFFPLKVIEILKEMLRTAKLVYLDPEKVIDRLSRSAVKHTLLMTYRELQLWPDNLYEDRVNHLLGDEIQKEVGETRAAAEAYWSTGVYEVLGLDKSEGVIDFDQKLRDSGRDSFLFEPFIGLLPILLNSEVTELISANSDAYSCQKVRPWINYAVASGFREKRQAVNQGYPNLNEFIKEKGQRCLVTYYDSSKEEKPILGDYLVTTYGSIVVREAFIDGTLEDQSSLELEKADDKKIKISPRLFWNLILAQHRNQHRHPLFSYYLFRFITPEVLEVFEKEIAGGLSIEQTRAIFAIPAWVEENSLIGSSWIELYEPFLQMRKDHEVLFEGIESKAHNRTEPVDEVYKYVEDATIYQKGLQQNYKSLQFVEFNYQIDSPLNILSSREKDLGLVVDIFGTTYLGFPISMQRFSLHNVCGAGSRLHFWRGNQFDDKGSEIHLMSQKEFDNSKYCGTKAADDEEAYFFDTSGKASAPKTSSPSGLDRPKEFPGFTVPKATGSDGGFSF